MAKLGEGKMAALTFKGLQGLEEGKWASDLGARGGGTLVARRVHSGMVLFYFRYTNSKGARVAIPLGQWDAGGGENLSLAKARDTAEKLSARYRAGERDLREILEIENRERQRQLESLRLAEEAAKAAALATLGAVLEGYVAQLKRDNKPSAKHVERSIHLHVKAAWPKLWATPEREITTDDLLEVVAKVADAGKLREAAKVRSYLSSAYSAAIRARQDARSLASLRDLKVTRNPASDLVTIEGANGARERVLSLSELRCYWKRVSLAPDPTGALLRFHLLTGGQRIKQLGRVKKKDYDIGLQSILISDIKGRRKVGRAHHVPLIAQAIEAMKEMRPELGPYLFTVTAGESGASYSSVRDRVNKVANEMNEAGELENGLFTPGDVRRTVETRLSAMGYQPFDLAQLQSHGLSGVQQRHYNKHDYLEEKRKLLKKLYELVTDSPKKKRASDKNRNVAR